MYCESCGSYCIFNHLVLICSNRLKGYLVLLNDR